METKDRGGLALARAVQTAYREGQTDYSLEPMVRVDEQGHPVGTIQDGDSVIFCCRRGEREIELTEAFTEPDFDRFPRVPLKNLEFVIMTMYHEKFKHLPIAFAPEKTVRPLAQVISEAGLRQFHCAESEKYAHVTFFFNGGENQPFPGEDDVRIPSPKGIPFDQKPELSLPQVADRVMAAADTGYDFILTNFANGDVIGHTANAEAKLTACHVVSQQVARVASHALEKGYIVCITADHGNIETLRTEDGKPHVAHTTNPVPFLLLDPEKRPVTLRDGILGDVAPTILSLLGLEQPPEMTGTSLLESGSVSGSKVMLIILDGWGYGTQDDVRMDHAIHSGSFRHNPVFLRVIDDARASGHPLHLIAYLTHKSSHGCIDYPLMLTEMAEGVTVWLHIIFDGRSTPPGSAPELLQELEDELNRIGRGQIADGVGRGIALDRDGNYEKVRRAYEAMVLGKGTPYR